MHLGNIYAFEIYRPLNEGRGHTFYKQGKLTEMNYFLYKCTYEEAKYHIPNMKPVLKILIYFKASTFCSFKFFSILLERRIAFCLLIGTTL